MPGTKSDANSTVGTTLMLCLGFPPNQGGIQRLMGNLCSAYACLRPLIVMAPEMPGSSDYDRSQPFRTYRYRSRVIGDQRPTAWRMLCDLSALLGSVSRIACAENVEAVCCGEASLLLLVPARLLQAITHCRYYCLVHGTDFLHIRSAWQKYLLSRLLLAADGIIANSASVAARVSRLTSVASTRIAVIHPGLDSTFLSHHGVQEWRHVSRQKHLLTVARLVKRKGHEVVLQALPRVIRELPDVSYRIVGDGPNRAPLEELVARLGLKEKVVFVGSISDEQLHEEYRRCDVFVMPSTEVEGGRDIEGFGIAYLEANAHGKPVIGGKSGGVADAVLDQKTGLLVDPTNPGDIADAILRLLCDDKLAATLGAIGRERVKSFFTSENMAGQFARVLFPLPRRH